MKESIKMRTDLSTVRVMVKLVCDYINPTDYITKRRVLLTDIQSRVSLVSPKTIIGLTKEHCVEKESKS